MEYIEIKEFDTLRISVEYKNDNGMALALNNINLFASMHSLYDNSLGINLIIEQLEVVAGTFVLTTNKASIKPQKYKIDILFEDSVTGSRITSETFGLKVNDAVTVPGAAV